MRLPMAAIILFVVWANLAQLDFLEEWAPHMRHPEQFCWGRL